jgi:D-glycero-beta-D-manno-heptose 1-phosphate adenylyltransferase
MTGKSRILSPAQLAKELSALRKKRQKIVLTQGSFDMVHIGHARYLEKAKSYGDVLVVGVDSDEKVTARKGPDRPVVPQDERLEMLTYLRPVDFVVLKKLDAAKYELIKKVQPDVLIATSGTYTPEKLAEVKKLCDKVVVLDPQATTSTSAKIRRVQIGAANRMSAVLSKKLVKAIEEVLAELKGEK